MAKAKSLTSVVVPTDFSPGGQAAIERALHLPLSKKAKVTLLHVVPDDIPGRLRQQAIAEAEAALEKALDRVHGLAQLRGLAPSQFVTDVVEGDAATQILKRAHSTEADLVVLGRHGRRPVADLFLGSTAQKVVRSGDVPVLVVQRPPGQPWAHALVAVDVQRAPAALVKQSQPLLELAGDVTFFHASRLPFEEYVTMTGELTRSYRDEFLSDAKEALRALVAKTGISAKTDAQSGDPRLLVLEEVRRGNVDLLVVGTHRKKRLERLFIGSVAEWLMTHAPCDVLVARL